MATLRVVGYVRCSTDEQATEGVTLDAQRSKLAQFARLHDLDLVAVEVDAGVSAKTLDRPGLGRALAMLDAGEADGLAIVKLDRLSRSVSDWNRLIDGYFGPAAGKQLLSVADSINTATAAGRLVLNVLMTVAQWERETIVERTRDALAHKRSRSERTGSVPYGKRLAGDGKTLLDDPAELEALALVRGWRSLAEPWPLRKIAAELTARGVPTRSGRPWRHTSIVRILERTP